MEGLSIWTEVKKHVRHWRLKMSKERLEEIKEQFKYLQGDFMRDDLGWLIKQAERVQELEDKFEERENELIRILTNRYKYITQLENTEIILREQSKRYRDFIETASDPWEV